MKKEHLFFVGVLILLFLSSTILAQESREEILGRGVEKIGEVIGNIPILLMDTVSYLYSHSFLGLELNKEAMFRFYISAILILIIFSIIDMIDFVASKNFWVKLALSIGIGGLAIIALPDGFIELLMPSYESMFSTLLSILPFGLILYFSVQIKNLIAGRVLWFFVTVYFILLFITEGIPAFQSEKYIEALIYSVLPVFGILMTIFLREIRSWFFKGEAKELTEKMKSMIDIDTAVQEGHREEAEAYGKIARENK